jgi:hypothetical protein
VGKESGRAGNTKFKSSRPRRKTSLRPSEVMYPIEGLPREFVLSA